MGVLVGILFIIVASIAGVRALNMTPDQLAQAQWGILNPAMVCPHCQTKGTVQTKQITKKAGISGGKATAALMTGGLSVLATGLSRKEHPTQAHCTNCSATWTF